MKPLKPLICVDFDDTIWNGVTIIKGCIPELTRLRKDYDIAIFSARATDAERRQMKSLLDTHGVPYDTILDRKPNAVLFIDDKGWRFTSWANLPL